MARIITPARLATLNGQHVNFYVRCEVEDPDGAFADVTNLFGFDFFNGATWTDNLDQPVAQGTVTLEREHIADDGTRYSLSPTVSASPINHKADGSYARFLRAGRKIRLYIAWTADGVAAVAGDWLQVFLGKIDEVDWHDPGNTVALAIRDAGAWLQGRFVEEETEYSDDTGQPVEVVMQQILDDWQEPKLGPVVLYTPVSPGWNIRTFKQSQKSVMDALRDLALQIGWDVRFKWDDTTGTFRLTFYQPDRAKSVADWTLGPDQYYDVTALKEGDANVRNRIKAVTIGVDGAPLTSIYEDVQSQADFGILYMATNEDASSNIDTQAELDALTAAIGSDLSQPRADHEVENLLFPVAEIGDLGAWLANGTHYDADQLLAVVQIRHEFTREKRRTYIQTRGTVAGAFYTWIRKQGAGTPLPGANAAVLALKNWREIARTKTDITFGFEAVTGTDRIAVYQFTNPTEQAVTWPDGSTAPSQWLTADTTEITFTFPPSGFVTYAQLQPANAALEFGEFVRQRVFAVGTPPQIENEAQEVAISGLFSAVSFDVTDAQDLGGVLNAWVNPNSPDSADSSAAVDGTVAVGATPAHVDGSTVFTRGDGTTTALLADIPVHAGRGKRVYFEYVNSLGVSSGIIGVTLLSQGGIVDATGQLIPGAITAASQFAAGVQPVQVLAALPPVAPDGSVVLLTTDGQLYRRVAGAWTLEVKAVSLTGQIVTTQIADAAISTAKFAAGIGPVELLAATVGAPGLHRVALNTTDGKLYRSSTDGTAWVSAIPAADVTGQLVAAQIADASINTAKFAAGLRPVRIVAALPGAGDVAGDTVFLTTDNKLYRWTGAAWIASVATADLTGTVQTAQMAAGAVTSTVLADNAVTTPKLVAGAVVTASIGAGAVTAANILAGTITSTQIATDTIIAGNIAAGAITSSELAAGAVIAGKVAAGTITATEIAAATITAIQIATDTITAGNIAAGAITSSELAATSVIAGKIAAGAVSTTELAANAVTAAKIAAGTITANEIAGATITGAKIAGTTITAGNILAGTITGNELATNSVVAGKIAAGAINSSSLFVSGVVTATVISVSSLSAISTALGIIVSGRLNSANGMSYLDLNATGASPFIHHADGSGNVTLELLANGSATFYGTVASSSFTTGLAAFSGAASFYGAISIYASGSPPNAINMYDASTGLQSQLYTDLVTDRLVIWSRHSVEHHTDTGAISMYPNQLFYAESRTVINRLSTQSGATYALGVQIDGTQLFQVGAASPVSGTDTTSIWLIHAVAGGSTTLKQVLVDAANSSGSGYRGLRIVN